MIGEWEKKSDEKMITRKKRKAKKKQLWCVVDLDKRDVCVYVHTKHLFMLAHHHVLICLLLNWSWPFIFPNNDPWFFFKVVLFIFKEEFCNIFWTFVPSETFEKTHLKHYFWIILRFFIKMTQSLNKHSFPQGSII